MAPEKVIEMAKQAGFRVGYIEINDGSKYPFIAPITSTDVRHELQAFAQLVRNETLEWAAQLCDDCCQEQIRSLKL